MRKATQLCAVTAATGSSTDQTLFTSESGGITIMRHIRVANTGSGTPTFRIAIGGTSATQANCIVFDQPMVANTPIDIYGYFVLPASTAVHAAASSTAVTFTISGDVSEAGG